MVSYKEECEKLTQIIKTKEKQIKFLTRKGKYKDIEARIKGQQHEIEILKDLVMKERNKLSEGKINQVLRFLVKNEMITNYELKRIISRYRFISTQKRAIRESEEKQEKSLISGVDKVLSKYKEEIELGNI